MSWGEMVNGPSTEDRKLLRDCEDWAKHEKAFRENIRNFVDSIEVANKIEEDSPVRKDEPQPCEEERVEKQSEKTQKKEPERKETHGVAVESTSRAGAQEVPRPAEPTEPARPAEAAEPNVPDQEQAVKPAEDWFSTKSKEKSVAKPSRGSSGSSSFPDFDAEGFGREMNKMADVIERVRQFDLDRYVSQIGSFGVHVDLDAHRENPEVIAEAFTLIYGAYTTAHARLMELLPIRHRIDSVVDYLMDVGIAFSQAGNKERRTGQVKLELGELISLQEQVREVCDGYERTCKHLLAQHDMVSRLFTWHQNYLIPRNIGMKFPGDGEPASPSPSRVAVKKPRFSGGDEGTRTFSENEFSGLDEMPAKPKMKDKQPGFVDFGF